MHDGSLLEHLDRQLQGLSAIAGTDPLPAGVLLADLLGPAGSRSLSQPPAWPSGIADDHTPVEFSLAFNENAPPTLRVLAEALGPEPDAASNLAAAHRFVRAQAGRFGLALTGFDRVADLFAATEPQGGFGLWHAIVFRRRRKPEFKVYFNPEVAGVPRSPALVAEALRRLGLGRAFPAVLEHAIRPGELGRRDRLTFFALDLHDGPHARVKLYLSHHDAQAADVARAAGAVAGIDPSAVTGFCAAAGRTDTFDRRPLVGSYTFLGGSHRPVGYSVYVPIRSYAGDDEEARDRVVELLDAYGFDGAVLDRAIAALTRRRLRDGTGLIAHVSLRLGPPQPGVTVYLSAEAYRVLPPRPRAQALDLAGVGGQPTDDTDSVER